MNPLNSTPTFYKFSSTHNKFGPNKGKPTYCISEFPNLKKFQTQPIFENFQTKKTQFLKHRLQLTQTPLFHTEITKSEQAKTHNLKAYSVGRSQVCDSSSGNVDGIVENVGRERTGSRLVQLRGEDLVDVEYWVRGGSLPIGLSVQTWKGWLEESRKLMHCKHRILLNLS